jgi:type II secretion system protein C
MFAFGFGVLYFTTRTLPLDYRFPRERQKTVNLSELNRVFLSFFPEGQRQIAEISNPTSLSLPKPLEVEALLKLGNRVSVILRAGREKLLLFSGGEVKGWRVLGVEGNRVVLSFRGRVVKLPIPKPEQNSRREAAAFNSLGKTYAVRTVSREEVRRLVNNYGELLKGVDFVAVVKNGKTVGFKIRYLSPSNIFYKLGFRIGDLIVSVNGVRLKDINDLFRVLQIVQNEPNVRVELIRNGKPTELNIRIE